MDGDVDDSEPVVCFAVEKNKIKADGIHWRAFLPSPDGFRSVYRVKDLNQAEILDLGNPIATGRGKTLYGWGQLLGGQVREKLPLARDEPPDRHAVIAPWPQNDAEQEQAAVHFASVATTVRTR